jgi:hypothetical protein
LAGGDGQGGCWSPVGFIMTMLDGSVRANILKEQYVRSEGFEEIKAPNKKALKEIINKKYNWIKESNG